MRGASIRQARPVVAAALALAAVCLAATAATADPVAEARGGAEQLFAVSSGSDAEIQKLLPVSKPSNPEERVVMSLRPGDLPALEAGDRVRPLAELQLSTTCVDNSRRCIGRPYGLSPKMKGHLVITNGRRKTGGRRISGVDSKRCHQPRPHRNHHCVLVIKDGGLDVGDPADLPCPPDQCYINMVASAESRKARRGNVVVVGADTPSGRVRQDKGRLEAVILRGDGLASDAGRTQHRVERRVPVADAGKSGLRVIYSLPLRGLERGDAFVAEARQRMKIHHLPYPVFVGTQMVVGRSKQDVSPGKLARQIVVQAGQVTEGNGFNCTRGNSAYESPCITRKIGLVRVQRDAVDGRGRPVTLYLNLVANAAPKRARPGPSADARALSGGYLQATRYRDPS
jgi:hypothetical protein